MKLLKVHYAPSAESADGAVIVCDPWQIRIGRPLDIMSESEGGSFHARTATRSAITCGNCKRTKDWRLLLAMLAALVLPFEYMPGLWTCPRGYVIRSGQCLADAEVTHGPVMEVSTLPSAGDGAPGTVCPSGGCSVLRDYNSTYVHVFHYGGRGWR